MNEQRPKNEPNKEQNAPGAGFDRSANANPSKPLQTGQQPKRQDSGADSSQGSNQQKDSQKDSQQKDSGRVSTQPKQ